MALEWFFKAAQLGLDFAQRELGIIYYEGLGISRDYSKTMEWYLKSAYQGCRNFLNYVGVMYSTTTAKVSLKVDQSPSYDRCRRDVLRRN